MQPERIRREEQALEETQDDSRDNFAANMVTPMTRSMFRGGVLGAIAGAIAGGLIGFAAAFAIYGMRVSPAFIMVIVALGFAGAVAGGVVAGWRGGLVDKAIDERRPSYADRDARQPHGTTPKGWK